MIMTLMDDFWDRLYSVSDLSVNINVYCLNNLNFEIDILISVSYVIVC